MAVDLSITNVPDEIVERLLERAKRNHRSLQDELMSILDSALEPSIVTVEDLHREVTSMGLTSKSESTAMLREDRDAH